MVRVKVVLLTVFLCILCAPQMKAQTDNLSPEQLEEFRTEVKHRVNRYQMYLTFIASKKNDVKTKQAYIRQALRLFMGKGDSYNDVYGNVQPAVRTQLSNTRTGDKYWRKTKTYLKNLMNLNYKKLEITWADACRVGKFHKVREGLYVTTVTMLQRFEGVRDVGSVVNVDEKSMTVYLEEEVTTVGGRYRVLFGDVEIQQTF